MTVEKFFNKPKISNGLVFVFLISMLCLPTYQLVKCNRHILGNFYLTGVEHSIYEPMHICPHIHDKCCTLADEVKIKNLIEKHTNPILERRVTIVMRSIGAILDSFMELVNIDPGLMVVTYSTPREVFFKEERCYSLPRTKPTVTEKYAFKSYHNGINQFVRKQSLNNFLKIKKKRHQSWWKSKYGRKKHPKVNKKGLENEKSFLKKQKENVRKHKKAKKVDKKRQELRKVNKQSIRPYQSRFIPYHPIHLFKFYPSSKSTECIVEEQQMHRDFVVVNQEKVKYCVGLHDAFMDMNLKYFIKILSNIQMSLTKVVSMKNTLYCSICDAHKQQFFKEKEKEIIMSKKFCRDFLAQEQDYFTFMHIILVEFLNQITQYLACFETDARVFEFPFPSFMIKYTRRISFVKQCLSSLNDKDNFYRSCFMLCRHFSLLKFSNVFEGDLELYKRVNVSLNSFLRKYRRGVKVQNEFNDKAMKRFGVKLNTPKEIISEITLPENVDGVLMEPFGPHSGITDKKYYFDKSERIRQYGHESTEQFDLVTDLNNKKEKKKMQKLIKQFNDAANEKEKAKLKKKLMEAKRDKSIYVPPKKKKFKVPLKKPVLGASGIVDRLSTRMFHENLKSYHYPQRGPHKLLKSDWKFTKYKTKYHKVRKSKKKGKAPKPVKKNNKKPTKKGNKRILEENEERELRVHHHQNKGKPGRRNPVKRKNKKNNKKDKKKGKKDNKAQVKKKTVKGKAPKKKKNPFKIEDKISKKVVHKHYKDVISSPQKHAKRKFIAKPLPPLEPNLFVEQLHEIFMKNEMRSQIMSFNHEFEDDGINPLYDLDHVNFKFNTTTLIAKRYHMPEKMDRSVVNMYLSIPEDNIQEFNKVIEEYDIEDFESVDEKVRDIKDLKKVRAELLKGDPSPMEITKINMKIKKLEKDVKENEARNEIVKKAMKARKNRKGHTDLNVNKYPDYVHHHDLYYNDTFSGITHMFEQIFGS